MTTAAACLAALRGRAETVATAESLTAGMICATLADVPGASDVLRGGLAAYATEVKWQVLGVDRAVVDGYGVVSAECAEAMARAACLLFDADWAVSATGVAGPTDQDGIPVGTVFVGVCGPAMLDSRALALSGDRQQIRGGAVTAALVGLAAALGASPA